ncbi:MAG TPA: hypothetical protein VIT91_12955 [Chthoniobacterales bacterium]
MFLVFFGLWLTPPAASYAETEPTSQHEKEELGINEYTTPSIEGLFRHLDFFAPIPVDSIARPLKTRSSPNRVLQALEFGSMIADGFLLVEEQKNAEIQNFGRELLRRARSLGVGTEISQHAQSLMDLGRNAEWPELRQELIATQQSVEKALIELRDDELAHMISLGGWFRALEFASASVVAKFSPEKALGLANVELLDYYIDRMETLSPSLRATPTITLLLDNLRSVRMIVARPSISPEDAQHVFKLAQDANRAIRNDPPAPVPSRN